MKFIFQCLWGPIPWYCQAFIWNKGLPWVSSTPFLLTRLGSSYAHVDRTATSTSSRWLAAIFFASFFPPVSLHPASIYWTHSYAYHIAYWLGSRPHRSRPLSALEMCSELSGANYDTHSKGDQLSSSLDQTRCSSGQLNWSSVRILTTSFESRLPCLVKLLSLSVNRPDPAF